MQCTSVFDNVHSDKLSTLFRFILLYFTSFLFFSFISFLCLALVSDARRKSSNSVNTGTVSVPLSASVPVPLTAQQLALAAAEEELMTVMNEMEGNTSYS